MVITQPVRVGLYLEFVFLVASLVGVEYLVVSVSQFPLFPHCAVVAFVPVY